MKNNKYDEVKIRLLKLKNTNNLTLLEIKNLVGFLGSMPTFRVLIWRLKLPYKKIPLVSNFNHLPVIAKELNFSDKTLLEIKEILKYNGSVNSLRNLIVKHNISYVKAKRMDTYNIKMILNKLARIDDKMKYTPQQLLNKCKIDVVNPSSFLRKHEIPYKSRL